MRSYFVWGVLWYLRFWAKVALRIHRPYSIGIAGSVGKSSTRNALNAVLKDSFRTKVVPGNSETGIPLGILGFTIDGFTAKDWLKRLFFAPFKIFNLWGVQYLIIEMGIDDPEPPKNMTYLLSIIKPDMSIDLNATATHTAQFEKLLKKNVADPVSFLVKKIAEEDSKIITNSYTKVGIYNSDDTNLSAIIPKITKGQNKTLFTFGSSKDNDITYKEYSIRTNKTKYVFTLHKDGKEKLLELTFSGLLLPPASRESFSSVILAALHLGLKPQTIKEHLEKNFSIPKGRSSLLPGIKGSLIIDSSYNSSKSSVLSFLDLLRTLKEKTKRPVVFLMGDMRELGNESKMEHEEIAHNLVNVVDQLYCVGPQTGEYVVPIVKQYIGRRNRTRKVEWYKNAVQAGLHVKEELPPNALILVKGSQNTIYLEEAIKFLLENPAETKQLTRQDDYWMKVKQEFFRI